MPDGEKPDIWSKQDGINIFSGKLGHFPQKPFEPQIYVLIKCFWLKTRIEETFVETPLLNSTFQMLPGIQTQDNSYPDLTSVLRAVSQDRIKDFLQKHQTLNWAQAWADLYLMGGDQRRQIKPWTPAKLPPQKSTKSAGECSAVQKVAITDRVPPLASVVQRVDIRCSTVGAVDIRCARFINLCWAGNREPPMRRCRRSLSTIWDRLPSIYEVPACTAEKIYMPHHHSQHRHRHHNPKRIVNVWLGSELPPVRYHQQLWPRQKTEWDGDSDRNRDGDGDNHDDHETIITFFKLFVVFFVLANLE